MARGSVFDNGGYIGRKGTFGESLGVPSVFVFDAATVGGESLAYPGTTNTKTWTHTTVAGMTYVVVVFNSLSLGTGTTVMVSYRGQTLTELATIPGSQPQGAGRYQRLHYYGKGGFAPGAGTVSVNISTTSSTDIAINGISLSYNAGVPTIGTVTSALATSVSVPGSTAGMTIIGAVCQVGGSDLPSGFSGNQRGTSQGSNTSIIVGDLAGSASAVTVSATIGSPYWGNIAAGLRVSP